MDTGVEYLKKLLDEIKNAGFWSRIFNWKQIRMLLPGAFADLQKLQTNLDNIQQQLIKADLNISGIVKERDFAGQMLSRMQLDFQNLERDNNENAKMVSQLGKQDATNKETIINLSKRKQELESELAHLKNDMTGFRQEFERISRMNEQFVQEEESRKKDHTHSMLILKEIKDKIESDRKIETDLQGQNEIARIFNLKETWSNHEENVKNVIKTIASKQGIDYVDKVPFKGTPDNTLKICDEFVILDAKSPASDDLSNFPSYLKDQSEKAGKYAREEDVKRDIFFVVPTNTLEALDHFVYRLAEYNVFIISIDALEPVILALQKLEAYEFAEQLSPEERENICRVLGRFGHLAKRRIQVDSFFIRQFMELAYMAESDLPKDILDQVVEFEKAEKLNPPVERRTKQISLKELEKDVTRLNSETTGKGIAGIENDLSLGLNKLPLHNEEITAL